jgi:Fic family protein
VHPFTDGNGRIGRALVNLVLRRRGVTTRVVVPLASSVTGRRRRYFRTLGAYTRGDLEPLLASFAAASGVAVAESRVTATRLAGLPAAWRDQVGGVRPGGVVATLLDALPAWPFLSADDAESLTGAPRGRVLAAIGRLQDAGVLRPLTRRRDAVWAAAAILDELSNLDARIARAAWAGA